MKRQGQPIRFRVYRRHLMSYCALTLLPFVIVFSLSQFAFAPQLRENIREQNQTLTQRISQTVDDTLKNISALNLMIKPAPGNNRVGYLLSDSQLKTVEGKLTCVGLLSISAFLDPLIVDIAYYARDIGRVFTIQNAPTLSTYFTINHFGKMTVEMYEWFFHGSASHIAFADNLSGGTLNSIGDCIVLMYRLDAAHAVHYVLGDFCIEQKTSYGDNALFIIAPDGTVLYSTFRGYKGVNLADIDFYDDLKNRNAVAINGVEYDATQLSSSVSGWTYLNLIPTRTTMLPLLRMRTAMLLCMAILVPLLAILLALIIRRNVTPLREIAMNLSPGAGNVLDEYSAMRNLLSDSKSWRHSIRTLLKPMLVEKLVRGAYSNQEEFNAEGRHIDCQLEHACCTVVIALTTRDDMTPELLESIRCPGVYCLADRDMSEKRFVLLINGACDNLPDYFDTLVAQCGVRLGVGHTVRDYSALFLSYMQADEAAHQIGDASIVRYGKDTVDKVIDAYPGELMNRFRYQLYGKDFTGLRVILQEISALIQDGRVSTVVARYLLDNVLNSLLFTQNIRLNESALRMSVRAEICTAGDIVQMLNIIHDNILSLEQAKSTQEVIVTMEQAENCVAEHMAEYDFSVASFSQCLGLSESQCAIFLRMHTDMSPLAFINYVRIKYAKEWLRNSDVSISYIVEKVGYVSASSFIRKFKAMEGMTPGQYRELKRNKRA